MSGVSHSIFFRNGVVRVFHMRVASAIAVIVALTLRAAVASDITSLGTFGAWEAYGGLAEDGKQVCGLSEMGTEGRSIQIKYFLGTDHLTIQIFKAGWAIPPRTPISIVMQLGKFSPWNVQAYGSGQLIESAVSADKLPEFVLEFRAADHLNLTFLTGNEGAWVGSLAGSGAAMDRLTQCLDAMKGTGPTATQPFNSAPSQPYDPGTPPRAPSVPALPTSQGQRL
jgi:hypothetical protein